jgi:hypothetical protein
MIEVEHLWNVDLLQWDYMAQYPRRLQSSHCRSVSHVFLCTFFPNRVYKCTFLPQIHNYIYPHWSQKSLVFQPDSLKDIRVCFNFSILLSQRIVLLHSWCVTAAIGYSEERCDVQPNSAPTRRKLHVRWVHNHLSPCRNTNIWHPFRLTMRVTKF